MQSAVLPERLPPSAVASSAQLWVCDDAGAWSRRASLPFGHPE